MTPPINIDGSKVTGITIDGTDVSEVTVDGQTVFAPNAIPDSENLHAEYDAKKESASNNDSLTSITDHQGGFGDLSGSATYLDSELNNEPAFDFDPSNNDEFTTGSVDTDLSGPQTVYIVYRLDNTSGGYNAVGFSRDISGGSQLAYRTRSTGSDLDSIVDSDGNVFAASYGTDIGTPHILCGVFQSGAVIERDDQSAESFSGFTTGSYSSFGIGNDAQSSGDHWEGPISAALVYGAAHGSSTRSTVFTYLGDRYGF